MTRWIIKYKMFKNQFFSIFGIHCDDTGGIICIFSFIDIPLNFSNITTPMIHLMCYLIDTLIANKFLSPNNNIIKIYDLIL